MNSLRDYMIFQGLSGFYEPGGRDMVLPILGGAMFKVLPDGETFKMWNRGGMEVTGGLRLFEKIIATGDLNTTDPDIEDVLLPKSDLQSPEPEVTSTFISGDGSDAVTNGIGSGESEDPVETGKVDTVKADTEVESPPVSTDPLDDLEAGFAPSPVIDPVRVETVEDVTVDAASPPAAAPFRKVRQPKNK